jgi:DNA-binding NarL/FixJ family response regulator
MRSGRLEWRMKTLLVDDHTLFRDGLSMLMAQRFPEAQLVAVADIGAALAVLAAQPDVTLVLLDLGLPDSQGLDSLASLQQAAPEAAIVVLSADDRPETILAAIEQGAAGFIPKTARLGAIEAALRVVLDGGVHLPEGIVRSLAPAPRPGLDPARAEAAAIRALGLSRRQADVLRLLVHGSSTKLMSRQLTVAESTVKTHLIALFRKLDVNSRSQAVIAAARMGLTFER